MTYQPTNKTGNQRHSNGSRCNSDEKPLQRINVDHLKPGDYESRIAKCKKNICHLNSLSGDFKKQDVELLVSYYESRLKYYQNKIDTAHAWLLDVESPQTL